jgi:hypothetical protein
MTQWRVIEEDRRTAFCPIALELRDEYTGGAIIGEVKLSLDIKQVTSWLPSEIKPARTPGGVFVYTGLGHAVDPAALPSFRARVRIGAAYYRPRYQVTSDGLEFDVPTYNDAAPLAMLPAMPEIALMLPAASYPFGAHIRVLHGRVLDPGGEPVADALVEADGVERVISDERGSFSLPLRWQPPTGPVAVTVDHPRSGLSALVNVNLPADLIGSKDITII